MNFKDLVLVYEDAASQERAAINILKRAKLDDQSFATAINALKNATAMYNNDRAAKNNAHMPDLAKLLVSSNFNYRLWLREYQAYMQFPKLKTKPLSRYQGDFMKFVEDIHAEQAKHEQENQIKTANDFKALDFAKEAIYEDENLYVFLADTPEKAIKYGQGTKYGLCISRPLEGMPGYDKSYENYFWHYRLPYNNDLSGKSMSTYFIYFKDQTINPPSNFIIVDAMCWVRNGVPTTTRDWSYNPIANMNGTINRDYTISRDALIGMYPMLQAPFEREDILEYIPLTVDELLESGSFNLMYYAENSTLEQLKDFLEKKPILNFLTSFGSWNSLLVFMAVEHRAVENWAEKVELLKEYIRPLVPWIYVNSYGSETQRRISYIFGIDTPDKIYQFLKTEVYPIVFSKDDKFDFDRSTKTTIKTKYGEVQEVYIQISQGLERSIRELDTVLHKNIYLKWVKGLYEDGEEYHFTDLVPSSTLLEWLEKDDEKRKTLLDIMRNSNGIMSYVIMNAIEKGYNISALIPDDLMNSYCILPDTHLRYNHGKDFMYMSGREARLAWAVTSLQINGYSFQEYDNITLEGNQNIAHYPDILIKNIVKEFKVRQDKYYVYYSSYAKNDEPVFSFEKDPPPPKIRARLRLQYVFDEYERRFGDSSQEKQESSTIFKDHFLLHEDAASQERAMINILSKLEDVARDAAIEFIHELQADYSHDRATKNGAHLPDLAKLLVSSGLNTAALRREYAIYMKYPKLKTKPLGRFGGDFTKFVEEVHAVQAAEEGKESMKRAGLFDPQQNKGEAVYEDNDVYVFLANTPEEAIKYGQGNKYGLCISRPLDGMPGYDPGYDNYFWHYRYDSSDPDESMSTYFVYFKNPEINPPSGFIIVDAKKNTKIKGGVYSYNKIANRSGIINRDREIHKDDLVYEYPVLKRAFDNNVFKFIPVTKKEILAMPLGWKSAEIPVDAELMAYLDTDEHYTRIKLYTHDFITKLDHQWLNSNSTRRHATTDIAVITFLSKHIFDLLTKDNYYRNVKFFIDDIKETLPQYAKIIKKNIYDKFKTDLLEFIKRPFSGEVILYSLDKWMHIISYYIPTWWDYVVKDVLMEHFKHDPERLTTLLTTDEFFGEPAFPSLPHETKNKLIDTWLNASDGDLKYHKKYLMMCYRSIYRNNYHNMDWNEMFPRMEEIWKTTQKKLTPKAFLTKVANILVKATTYINDDHGFQLIKTFPKFVLQAALDKPDDFNRLISIYSYGSNFSSCLDLIQKAIDEL